MRKRQQQQILDLLETIKEAQSEGLYADCQAGALSVGEFIENIAGEDTQTVALLEDYCELLYRASTGEITEKPLIKQLIAIENSVKTELKPDKIEIAFLPYQLSMWDSLESIWLAAKNDPLCDAYIVPIPYYELNPGGTHGKMHYDGDKYPDGIPVTDWREYDVEARQPDIVFTHYPYDDSAGNARIHPAFYSRRLRENCQLLVHVPYFVSTADYVDDYNGYLPGILYAHHVLAQSEPVRQSYIGHYKKFDRECGWNGQFGRAEEKFVTLGSPKFDKVLNSAAEDFELPGEWRTLIYKSDGTRKKAVLYNTHMFTWINGGEQYFEKLRSVFDAFRGREDVVLWWRPHPNTEVNFRTKCPQRLGEYEAVVEEYRRGGWGIYDDTPDLHRALAACGAYYGDWSSLVTMFGVTGKPVIIQIPSVTGINIGRLFGDRANPPDKAGEALSFNDYITHETSDVSFPLNENGEVIGQRKAFGALTAVHDGSSGVRILQYVKDRILS